METTSLLNIEYRRRPSTLARSPFRYPGGKGFLTDLLRQKVYELDGPNRAYAEAFCGGAGAAINLLLEGHVDSILLNDLDSRVYSAWEAIIKETDRFLMKLRSIDISVDEWRRQKEIASSHLSGYSFDAGFAAFYLNRTSRAGILLGSGPIGGYEQSGDWKIDARFYRNTMISRIEDISRKANKITTYNLPATDFLDYISDSDDSNNTFVFIDPPYYEIGSRLYFNGMGERGHIDLSNKLKAEQPYKWLITYDDHEEIRKLYVDFNITGLEVLYSLQKARRVKEILIESPN
jgi:DNA adenine methylase